MPKLTDLVLTILMVLALAGCVTAEVRKEPGANCANDDHRRTEVVLDPVTGRYTVVVVCEVPEEPT